MGGKWQVTSFETGDTTRVFALTEHDAKRKAAKKLGAPIYDLSAYKVRKKNRS